MNFGYNIFHGTTDLDGYTVWSFIGFHKMYISICLITGLGEASFAKVEPAKFVCVCVFWGVNFENSFGEALILDIPVKKVYNQLQNASSVNCCAQIKTIKWNPPINVKV